MHFVDYQHHTLTSEMQIQKKRKWNRARKTKMNIGLRHIPLLLATTNICGWTTYDDEVVDMSPCFPNCEFN